ncbi:MAG TPA: hypothetical protein VJG32_12175, partial [Anaerolineae bacterium]|nr:hypothetical protein [Anaerolineae bacterium]
MARLKDVLQLYAQPYDPTRPTLCFDEKSVQLLADSRPGLPLKPGYARRQDYEYVRRGTRNVFIFVEPKAGGRHVLVTRHRTKESTEKVLSIGAWERIFRQRAVFISVARPHTTSVRENHPCWDAAIHNAVCLKRQPGR